MPRRSMLSLALPLALLLLGRSASAEVSVRECIALTPGASNSEAYIVPANSSVTFASFQFNLYDASNAIFAAQVYMHDSSSPLSQRVRYDIQVDGSDAGRLTTATQYFERTPAHTQGTSTVRAYYQNIPAGDHTASLVINNLGTSSVLVFGTFMNSLFVDASEAAASYYSTATQTVSSSYLTVGQFTIPNVANRSMVISSYIRATAAGTMSFRYLVDGMAVEHTVANFRNSDDGALIDYILPNAMPGKVVQLQALGPGTISLIEMAGQELKQYSIMGGTYDTTGSVTAALPPSYTNYVAIPPDAELPPQPPPSGPKVLNSLSLSGFYDPTTSQSITCHWGTNDTILSMTNSNEVLIRLDDVLNGVVPNYDAGIVGHSPDSTPASYRQISDFVCGAGATATETFAKRESLGN
ncbi:MAG TPA: hypothetical protein VMM92_12770, partial [Thermoanaerobaculia bacterium]|nr:hypothetical protein [Thermoanaerobaculia bacterium]